MGRRLQKILPPDGDPLAPVPDEWWRRAQDSKTRALADKIFVMKAAGRSRADIARRLEVSLSMVDSAIYLARRNGWVDDDDEPLDMEVEMALHVDRKIVRNITASLDGVAHGEQQHEMTIAAAKGRGIFKNHDVSKVEGPAPMAVVAIQVVMPPVGAGDQALDESQIGGVPAYLDGEVAE